VNHCRETVEAIWGGFRSEEISAHLRTCAKCADAWHEKERLIQMISSLEVPSPSRSLLPSQEMIRSVVRRNRRRPWQQMSGIVAAVVLVFGTVTGLMMQHLEDPSVPGEQVPQQVVIESPQTDDALRQVGEAQNPNVAFAPVSVQIDPGAAMIPKIDVMKKYLESHLPSHEIAKAKVLTFIESQGSTKERSVGDLVYELELRPGASAVFHEGQNRSLLAMEQIKGQWEVTFFEPLIAPETAERAAQMWVKALSTRDGILLYAAMAPEMKAEKRSLLEMREWRVPEEEPVAPEGANVQKDSNQAKEDFEMFDFPIVPNSAANRNLMGTVTVKPHSDGRFYVTQFGYSDGNNVKKW
jgi:hypothetical protein